MQNLKFLNKKEIKNILNLIKNQWGCDIELDYIFSINEKNKLITTTNLKSQIIPPDS